MQFKTCQLPDSLTKYVESIFHFKDFVPDHSIERVVPTGHVFIIFELDGMVRNTFDNESLKPLQSFTRGWVSGMHKNHISISAHPNSEMFVIQFKAQGAHPFFHIPMHELNEKVVSGEELWGDEMVRLHQALLDGSESADKFNVAENWLKERYKKELSPSEEFLSILDELQKRPVSEHSEVTDRYSKSQKHFIDQFKKYVGLTPKYYQRILRFNEILRQINSSQKIEWSQIAYQCEYTDQSHFIKEFKHFSGFNPQEFIQNNFHEDGTNFFPLDREG